MTKHNTKNNEVAPPFSDEDDDDEFGGAILTLEKIRRNRNTNRVDIPSIAQNVNEDDDDEFGGARLTRDLIYNNSTSASTSKEKIVRGDADVEGEEGAPLFFCEHNIFSPPIGTDEWYVDRDLLTNQVTNPHQSITIPLVIDTEFTDNNGKKEYQQNSRIPLTTQICGIGSDTPRAIFALTPRVNAGRKMDGTQELPMIKSNFHPVDYLRDSCGLNVYVREATESDLSQVPKCFIVLYGHFLTAEINMIASGTVKERIKALQQSQGEEQISSGRRAQCQKIVDGRKLDWVSLKHIISIEGCEYELCLKLVDTGAIHGMASYKDFCSAVGWKLKYKDIFTSEEKSRMLDMAIERYQDFENYALGDLDVYEALDYYYKQWKVVYGKLGLTENIKFLAMV